MSDFHAAWALSRTRFVAELEGLSANQMQWRLYPGSLNIAEAALHLAGVEVKFGVELAGMTDLTPLQEHIRSSATDGVVNDKPFPFPISDQTPEFVASVLADAKAIVEPSLLDPTIARREISLVSALGPIISGEGAMARLAFHSAYHQGQVYMMRMHPDFPKN